MKLKIGSPATGDNYFPRTPLRARLVRALARDHVAFLGPRRTGKTSLLRNLESHPPDDTLAVYIDLQGLTSVPAWLGRMVAETKKALQTPPPKWAKLKGVAAATTGFLKRIEEIGVATGKIKLTANEPAVESWRPLANQFLDLLKETQIPLYFMLDEFPWFLGHVAKNHTPAEVDAVLNWFRELRLTLGDMQTRFLVTGSIGLNGLLRRLGLGSSANDFDTVEIRPLNSDEQLQYLQSAADGEGIALSASAMKRILSKMGTGWPYLLALFLSEVQEMELDRSPTTKEIESLYDEHMVRGSRNKYCHEMFTRITKPELFTSSERAIAQSILRDLCGSKDAFGLEHFNAIHARLVPEPTYRATLAGELDYVLETLRHDGYIVPNSDGLHHFSSNILRDYWRHRTA